MGAKAEDIKLLTNEMRCIKESMNFMNDKFESILKEFQNAKNENAYYKKEVGMLNEKVKYLEMQVGEMKNEQLRDNLEISGLPYNNDENCHMVAYNVFKKVYPEIKQNDIVEAYRTGSANDTEGKPRMYRNE